MDSLNYIEMYTRMVQNCKQVLLTMVIEDSKFIYKNSRSEYCHKKIQSYRMKDGGYAFSELKQVLCYKGLHTCRLSWVKILCPYFKKFIPELTILNMWTVVQLKHMDFRINHINFTKKDILRNFIIARNKVQNGRKLDIRIYDKTKEDRLFPLSEKKYYEFYKSKIENLGIRTKNRWSSKELKDYIVIANNGYVYFFMITIDTKNGRIYFSK
jgi:hypothetical protein